MVYKDSRPVAIFTDTLDQINGVANTYRHLAAFCRKTSRRLDLFSYGERDSVEEEGSVRIFRFRPKLPLSYYTDMSFDLCCRQRTILQICRDSLYRLVQAATPGSMGINALLVARKLGLPLFGCYHTALPEYLEARRKRLGVSAET